MTVVRFKAEGNGRGCGTSSTLRSGARRMLTFLLVMPVIGIHASANAADKTPESVQIIPIDVQGQGPQFEGLGALSAGASSRLLIDYPEPQRSQILDYLFLPGYGAALQHLKVEIGSDVNSTDGSEPSHMRSPNDHNYERGYEWWLMVEARKRNPQIILDTLPWGAPGWIGNGRLYSKDMAAYVVDFLQAAKKLYNLDIAYTGVWNERVYDAEYVKTLSDALKHAGLKTKIVCCDEYPGEGGDQWEIATAIQKDPALKDSIYAIGVHYPWVYSHSTTPAPVRESGKPLWSSEDQPNDGGGPIVSRDWAIGGRLLAKLYNRNYLEGGFTKTEIWSPITSYYDILAAPNSGLMYANTPWSGNYSVQGAIWATAHTTQFAQAGWTYDDPSCGYLAHGGSFVTFLSPDRKSWSTVIETIDARAAQTVRLLPTQSVPNATVHVWLTNASTTFGHVTDLPLSQGAYTFEVQPDSIYTVTTTIGQGKGDASPPPQAGFPLPYSDTFDSSPLTHAARYLADQDGAFEVQPCRQRNGNCLTQVITVKPTPWSPLPDPFTLAGDITWRNYSVAADVQIPLAGEATVFGRIENASAFADAKATYPAGYGLILKSDGHWRLISTAYKQDTLELAAGVIAADEHTDTAPWHRLDLSFEKSSVVVAIDGKRLAQVASSSHDHGMFSIGSDWSTVQFDNLTVNPITPQAVAER